MHAFLSSDTIVFQADTTASVLAVGGGGGGGSRVSGHGAGGGGGGALIFYPNYTFVAGSYYAKIGSGGTGGNCNYGRGGNTSIILSGSIMTFNALGGGGDEYNTCWKTFPGGSLSGSAALYGGGANLVNVPTGANECAPGLLQSINIAAGVEQPQGSKYVFTSVGGGPCDINYETVYQQTYDSGAESGGGGGGAGGPGYPDGMTAPSGGLGLGLPIFSELFGAAFNNLSPDGTIAGGGSGQCHLNRMVRGDDLCVALSSGGGGMGGLQDTNEYENGYNGLPNTGGGGGAEYHNAGGFPGSGGSGVVLIAYTTGCSRAYDVPAQYCPAGSTAPATCPGDYYCPDPSQKLPCSGCPAGSNALQEFSVGCLAGSTYSFSGATPCTKCSICDPGYYVGSPCTATSDTVCAPCSVCGGTAYCTAGCSPCVNSFNATAANIGPFGNFVPPVWCSAALGSVTFDTSIVVAQLVLPGGDYSVSYSIPVAVTDSLQFAYFSAAHGVNIEAIQQSSSIVYAIQEVLGDLSCLADYNLDGVPCTGSFNVTAQPYFGLDFSGAYSIDEQLNVQPSWTISWVGVCSKKTYSSSGVPPCAACATCGAGYYVTSPCTTTSDTECAPCPANYQCSNGIKAACPIPSVSPVGSSTFLNCSCPAGTAGWVTNTDTALCTPCLPGQYCQGSSCQCGPDKK